MECSTLVGILSVVVAALSVLVVILIGFQIYTLFDIRKIKNEVDKKRVEVNYEAERNMCSSAMALSDFYYSTLVNEPIAEMNFKYVHYRLAAILHASRIGDYKTCDAFVKALLESVPKDLLLKSQYSKQLLLNLMQEVQGVKNIQNFQDLYRLLLNLDVHNDNHA